MTPAKKVLLFLFFTMFIIRCLCLAWTLFTLVQVLHSMTLANLPDSVVAIYGRKKDQYSGMGTAFWYKQKNKTFLVSNRHILDDIKFPHVKIKNRTLGDGLSDIRTTLDITSLRKFITCHPDLSFDICALEVKEVAQILFNPDGFAIQYFWDTDVYKESNRDTFEQILITGYPLYQWGIHKSLTQVGYTSILPTENLDIRPLGVISYPCYGGSSGSPVTIRIKRLRDETDAPTPNIRLLGILTGALDNSTVDHPVSFFCAYIKASVLLTINEWPQLRL